MLSKIKFGFTLLVLIVLNTTLSAQSSEPLLDWYKSFFSSNNKQIETVIKQNEQKVVDAEEAQDLITAAKLHNELGLLYLVGFNYDSAMNHFIKGLSIEDSLKLIDEKVISYIAIAQVFEEVNDNQKSVQYLEQAREINYPTENYYTQVHILNKLGKINAVLKNREGAYDYYQNVLRYAEQIEDAGVEAEALFNIAHLLTLQDNYDEALVTHKKALSLRRNFGDKKGEAQSLNDIGELYWLMKNEGKALANFEVAVEIRQKLKDKKGLAETYNNLGILYQSQNNIEKAVTAFLKAMEEGQVLKDQLVLLKTYEHLSECYKALKDYSNALKYKEEYVLLNELISLEKDAKQVDETQNKHTLNQKESVIARLENIRTQSERKIAAQKELQKLLFTILGLGTIIVVLILVSYILQRRSNKKLQAANKTVQEQNLQLQELNATKDKFFSIISHDLKGPLNSFTSFSGLLINHTDSLSKDEIRMLAKDLDKSLKNLFDLLENLLEWSRSQTGNIEFKPEPFDLNQLLEGNRQLLAAQAQNKKITLVNSNLNPLNVDLHKHSINTVIRNLTSNAIKFTPEGGTITLSARENTNEFIISVTDTGVGMSKDILNKLFRIDTKHSTKGTADEKGTGLGLILCKEFVEKNGGRIWVESEVGKGSIFSFSVPKSQVNTLAEVIIS
ncbi:ATP-binding protein [Chryseosolibacter indicus]|uniref:histidine kinase n=1 Tax=Chryseosolibacter indicus TaxID=2782351 RepID=A0ABS5VUD2_9BACT|nr:tetratricopeptide repeat protein [Chryseosolibacter indicus]MBT1705042.1 tetratricopeptide repeat-containing sensor histidine kinase [Chryseosolibacter indicus]